MNGYTVILNMLDQLDAADRINHEREVQLARLKTFATKRCLISQAKLMEAAARWQLAANDALARLQR